jgi:hypothetical protein
MLSRSKLFSSVSDSTFRHQLLVFHSNETERYNVGKILRVLQTGYVVSRPTVSSTFITAVRCWSHTPPHVS